MITKAKNILYVEDDQALANLVKDYLEKHQFHVTLCSEGNQAPSLVLNNNPDLVILDIMLPGKSGVEICREVRSAYSGPIVMFSALDEDIDQMLALDLGADDYIIKPTQPRLLLSRLRALLRRFDHANMCEQNKERGSVIRHAMLEINLSTRQVSISNEAINLTTAEFELLVLIAQDAGSVVERETIAQQLRGFSQDKFDRSIDRRISRLRKKLKDDDAQLIKSIRGRGYQLCLPT